MSGRCGVTNIQGRRLAVGEATILRLAYLLGLEKAPPDFSIKSAAWIENHIELSVGVGNDQEVAFALERAKPDERAFVVTDHLLLRYRGKLLPPSVARWILAAAGRRMPPVTMERLVDLVASDPDLGKPGLPFPAGIAQHPANQLDTWGAKDAWADFFAGGEIARSQLDSIDPTKLFSFIQHCDNECLLVNPYGLAPLVSLVEFPWGDRARNLGQPPRQRGGGAASNGGEEQFGEMMTTELTERDVVLGNPDKVRDILDHAIARPNPDGRILFFSNTCVPTVTGEDVESVVRQYQRKSDVPLLYLTVTPKAMNDVFRDLLVTRRRRAEEASAAPDAMAVNLIGFADDPATAEIVALLDRFGIGVNTKLLPDLDVNRIDCLPRAALSVFRPNSVWAHFFEQLQHESSTRHVSPPAPFGREGTKRWLLAVLEGLGLPLDESVWTEFAAASDEAWRCASARASTHRLGLIVRGEEIHYLTDPGQTWGVPLLAVAEEAGFGLDVLVHVADEKTGRDLGARIDGAFPPPASRSYRFFKTQETFETLLEGLPCEAVLTHHFFDWRLTQAGKNRFSLQHFEMGLSGAVRTVDRLVEACEMPYFRRYRRYLRRTREGLRASPPGREDAKTTSPDPSS